MFMSHTCVDLILEPSGKFIERGFNAVHRLATTAPSMMKMDVAPVSAMARSGAIVMYMVGLAAASGVTLREQLEAIMVMSSSHGVDVILLVRMGFRCG